MANLFTRSLYDTDNLQLNDKSNRDSNIYLMNRSTKESATSCYSNTSGNATSHVSRPLGSDNLLDFAKKADIESRLQNRHVELNSKERTNRDYEKYSNVTPSLCAIPETMTNEDSRFTNPIVNYREMNTAAYNFTPYLHINPQTVLVNNTEFLSPSRGGVSSRFVAKEDKYNFTPRQFAEGKTEDVTTKHAGFLPTAKASTSVPAYSYSFTK